MQLLPNEERLVSSNEDKVVLTNQRLHLFDKEWGRSYQIVLFLENISSIEQLYQSNLVFPVLAGASFLFGVVAMVQDRGNNSPLVFWAFAVAVFFLVLWLSTKRRVVTITSHGGTKLNFRVDGMSSDQVEDFVDKVLAAQAARIASFHL